MLNYSFHIKKTEKYKVCYDNSFTSYSHLVLQVPHSVLFEDKIGCLPSLPVHSCEKKLHSMKKQCAIGCPLSYLHGLKTEFMTHWKTTKHLQILFVHSVCNTDSKSYRITAIVDSVKVDVKDSPCTSCLQISLDSGTMNVYKRQLSCHKDICLLQMNWCSCLCYMLYVWYLCIYNVRQF